MMRKGHSNAARDQLEYQLECAQENTYTFNAMNLSRVSKVSLVSSQTAFSGIAGFSGQLLRSEIKHPNRWHEMA